MSEFNGEVQIRKIRNRGSFGGIIFSAVTINDRPSRYVIKADWRVARPPHLFKERHIWWVDGFIKQENITWKDGTVSVEQVIIPTTLRFVKASHENLKRLLIDSPDFKGISDVKAEKLINFFGDELIQIAIRGHKERLLPIVGESVAERLIIGLQKYENLAALQLLDDLGIPPNIGDSVLKIWGSEAYSHINKNPYFLVAFMADLNVVDAYAIDRLGMAYDSPERLIAYVKSILFNAFSSGHTCLPLSDLKYQLKRKSLAHELVSKAISVSIEKNEIILHDDIVQVKSMHIIESGVALIIDHLSKRIYSDKLSSQVEMVLNEFEENVGFSLTDEQKHAVLQCCHNSITILTGGAGCGKTTVIDTICYALEQLNQTSQIVLMALAGKAAKRITEATGRNAMTIAGFLFNMEQQDLSEDAVIIVDEASMVDILSLYRILKRVPIRGRIIFTGDQEQLPPVGIGLSLHLMVNLPLSNPHLSTVQRQSEKSGIPNIAHAIRCYGDAPMDIPFSLFNGLGSGVSFVECDETDLDNTSINVYEQLGGDGSNNDVLILSPVKHQRGGVYNINALIHDNFIKGEELNLIHPEFGNVAHNIQTKSLRIGELVMYNKNDYEKGIMNGSIGKIVGKSDDLVIVDFDNNVVMLSMSDLNNLEHAYALTVHKSQGSQFDRVIVIVRSSRNLDRHLLYTAVTRAKHQVVFVGSKSAFYHGLERSNALKRHTLLSSHMNQTELS